MTQKVVNLSARTLADARVRLSTAKDALSKTLEALKPLDEWKKYNAAKEESSGASKAEKDAKAKLIDLALRQHEDTGDVQFADGDVTVFDRTTLVIEDEDRMYEWVIKNARYTVSVSQPKLKALAQKEEIPGVKIVKAPAIKVASDLSKHKTPAE